MTNRIGDRPRFPLPNQRFDKGDAEAISEYYESIISRFVGSMYGQAWGCVSNPQFYVESETVGGVSYYFVKMQKCVLLESVPDSGTLNTTTQDYGPWNARLVHYDPARTGQSLQLLNLFGLNGQRRWILFRRAETATGTSNKAYWDTTSNSEAIGAQPLVTSELVEFTTTLTYTESLRSSAGWVRMAYIDSWTSPSAPVIIPVHWIDSQYYNNSTPPTQSIAVGVMLNSPNHPASDGQKGFVPSSEMPELAKVLHWVTGKLAQHYSSTGTLQVATATEAVYNTKAGAFVHNFAVPGGWLSTPSRGLLELHNDLHTVETVEIPDLDESLTNLNNQFTAYQERIARTPRLLATLYVTPVNTDPPYNWVDYTFNVVLDDTHTQAFIGYSEAPLVTATGSSATTGIRYSITPIPPDDEFEDKIAEVYVTQPNPNAFMLTSLSVVADDLSAIYVPYQGYVSFYKPPRTDLRLRFRIRDPRATSDGEEPYPNGRDVVRPFTVYIYGRIL